VTRAAVCGRDEQRAGGHGRVIPVRQHQQVAADRLADLVAGQPGLRGVSPAVRPVVGETCEGLVRKLRIVVVAARVHDLEAGSQALLVGDGVESLNTHSGSQPARHGADNAIRSASRGLCRGACAAGLVPRACAAGLCRGPVPRADSAMSSGGIEAPGAAAAWNAQRPCHDDRAELAALFAANSTQ
jgi:hypothetical protein